MDAVDMLQEGAQRAPGAFVYLAPMASEIQALYNDGGDGFADAAGAVSLAEETFSVEKFMNSNLRNAE